MNNLRNPPGKGSIGKPAVSDSLPQPGLFNVEAEHASPLLQNPRLLFFARALNQGGAQRQLVTLACGLRARGWDVSVAQFYTGNPWEKELLCAGVTIHDLHKRGRWDVFAFLFRFGRLLRKVRPTILHGYLPMPNLLTVLLRPLSPGTRIVWGVRGSSRDLKHHDWLARLTFFLACRTARFANLIIANSYAGREYHIACGYPSHKMLVIPNGVDTNRFQFDATGRRRLRTEWGISTETVLIGLVGRLDPVKDHPTFLRAAALLMRQDVRCRFVCVGDGPPEYANELQREARSLGLGDRLMWAGARDDMACVYSAFDIACSSSSSEGLPNAVIEAMACGRPCVVTNVGDSAAVIGDTGWVVPPNDPAALSKALAHFLSFDSDDWDRLSVKARMRIVEQFSVERMVEATCQALDK